MRWISARIQSFASLAIDALSTCHPRVRSITGMTDRSIANARRPDVSAPPNARRHRSASHSGAAISRVPSRENSA